jgi:hypothetical protein
MPSLNHTIVAAHDPEGSAATVCEILGVGPPVRFGHFYGVEVEHGMTLDYMHTEGEVTPQHYAFLVSDEEFDEIFGRIKERGLQHWADPARSQPGEINTRYNGRGVYWEDPEGHFLEILTSPYGS